VKIKNQPISNLLFLFGICLSSLAFSPSILDQGLSVRFIIISVFTGLSLIFYLKGKDRSILQTDKITLFYLLYSLFCLFGCFYANTFSVCWFESLKILMGFFIFLLTPLILNSDLKRIFFNFSCLLPFIATLIAFLQFSEIKEVTKISLYEITGMNGHKNLFSSFLFLNSFFIFHQWRSSVGKEKYFPIAALLLTLLLLLLLQTKAVWIAVLLASLVMLKIKYILPRFKKLRINYVWTVIVAGIAIHLFLIFLLPQLVSMALEHNKQNTESKLKENKYELDNERLVLWEKTILMHKKVPMMGVGTGNWQVLIGSENINGLWRAEDLNFTFQRPHNDLLWILSENGWIGFELYLFFLLLLITLGFKTLQENGYQNSNTIGMALSYIFGFLVISFFDFPKERIEHLVWFNLLLGYLYIHIRKEKFNFQISDKNRNFFIQAAVTICVLSAFTGILRYKGEYYTRKIYEAKDSGSNELIPGLKEKALSFAYTIDPTSLPLSWYSGNAYLAVNDPIKALVELRKAAELNPYNRNVLNDLGTAYALLKDNAKAKIYFEEALVISTRFDEPALNLAAIYLNEKDTLQAGKILRHLYHDSRKRTILLKVLDAMKTDSTIPTN